MNTVALQQMPDAIGIGNLLLSIREAKHKLARARQYKEQLHARAVLAGGYVYLLECFPEITRKLIQPYSVNYEALEKVQSTGLDGLLELTGLSLSDLYESVVIDNPEEFHYCYGTEGFENTASLKEVMYYRNLYLVQYRNAGILRNTKYQRLLSALSGVEVPEFDDVMHCDYTINYYGRSCPGLNLVVRNKHGQKSSIHSIFFEDSPGIPFGPLKNEMQPKNPMLPTASKMDGCYVELAKPRNGVIGIGTSLTNSITIGEALGIPMRFVLNPNEIENLEFEDSIKKVHVFLSFSDKGPIGFMAVKALRERMKEKGISISCHWPEKDAGYHHWSQVYKAKGIHGLPKIKI